jgi:maleamate amidohydrolase
MAGRQVDDLNRDYSAAGFGNSLGFGKRPALLIIDFCQAYMEKSSPLYAGVEAELGVTEKLLTAARTHKIPVLFTTVRYTPGGKDGGLYYKKIAALQCFDAGNPLADFPPSLHPGVEDIVIIKQYSSAFFGTSLASTLQSNGIDCCVIAGLSTSGCVRATALDCLQHGFIPLVVRDACGDRATSIHEANLFDMQAKFADVIDSDVALRYFASL